MVNMEPLEEAWLATHSPGERNLIDSIIESIRTNSPFPRKFYESGEAGPYVNDHTYKVLGEVLRIITDDEERERMEQHMEGRGKKALDFSTVTLTPFQKESVDSNPNPGHRVPTVKATLKPKVESKRPRPPVKIRPTRKAGKVALSRIRGVKQSNEVINISSNDEPAFFDPSLVVGPSPGLSDDAFDVGNRVQPSDTI